MGTPMLVDSDWLDRANAALNALGFGSGTAGASTPAFSGTASRFYDVRPARIVGEWTRSAAGAWTARANFIVGDAVDDSFEFDVAAPLAIESETAPTAADATAFVVWRGRWEFLTGASAPTEQTATLVKNVGEADDAYFEASKLEFNGKISVTDLGDGVARVDFTDARKYGVELFPRDKTSGGIYGASGSYHYLDASCFGFVRKTSDGTTATCATIVPPKIIEANGSSANPRYITELVTDVSLDANGKLNVVKTPVELFFDGATN